MPAGIVSHRTWRLVRRPPVPESYTLAMRVSIPVLLLAGAWALGAQPALQSFDVYTYPAPAGYHMREGRDFIEWSRIDQGKRFYCQIGLFRAQNSTRTAADDIETEWKATVAREFKIRGEAQTRALPLPNAPESMVRMAETTDGRGNAAVSTLFVLRTPGRYIGVMFNVPNEEAMIACQPEALALVMGIRMSAAAPPALAPSTPAIAAPADAPAQTGGLTGSWERVIASQAPTRYNPITRVWEHDYAGALNQFRNVYRWRFLANGDYVRELDAENFNRAQRSRVIEKGRYTVSGGAIQFQPSEYREGTGPRGQDPPLTEKKAPAGYAIRYSIGEHPRYQDSAGLQIQESDGSWTTFRPAPR
ncbi:MAG: hypothetical protein K2X35_17290 [Bryobacteraceae bacterium]|nr:hypothetical protein [Bryobacteraceae bacterium]